MKKIISILTAGCLTMSLSYSLSVPFSEASNCTNWSPGAPPSQCSYTKTATRTDGAGVQTNGGSPDVHAMASVNCPNCDKVDDNYTCGGSVGISYSESYSPSINAGIESPDIIGGKLKTGIGLATSNGTQYSTSANCSFTPPECKNGTLSPEATGYSGRAARVISDYTATWTSNSSQPKLSFCRNNLPSQFTASCDSITSTATGNAFASYSCGTPSYTDCTNEECLDDDEDDDSGE